MKNKNILLSILISSIIYFPVILYAQQEDINQAIIKRGERESVGKKISLEIKGMDIRDLLKILATRGNLNIVTGKNVRGKAEVFLKNVEVMDALEVILAANGLAYEKQGNIISVMTERDYELLYGEKSYNKKVTKTIRLRFARATEVGKSLNQIKTKIGKVIVNEDSNTLVLIDTPQSLENMETVAKNMDLPTETRTFVLNYAKAKDLEETIKQSLSNGIGTVKIDERMNKIMVTDLPHKMKYISKLISDFDEKDKTVLIEAKIIQITLSKDKSYGVNWNAVFAGVDSVISSDVAVNLPAGVSSWPNIFTYTRANGTAKDGTKVILKMLEKLGKTNVLSTPRITVVNNQEAKVLVGTKEAYVTSTITQSDSTTSTADNVQFVDVGVSLSVTPTINEDGYINMKIKPEVSSAPNSLELTNADGSIRTSVPIVTTSEAETQLLVKDGTTIIMAGLMKDTRTDNRENIPLLGDIPLLGHFFRSKGKGNEKTELVIFLTPYIISEKVDASGNFQEYLSEHEKVGLSIQEGSVYKQPIEARMSEAIPSVSKRAVIRPRNFSQYCVYVSDKITRFIERNKPINARRQNIELKFVLTSRGFLKGEPSVSGNVDRETKDFIIKSVKANTPFLPFPPGHNQREETFRVEIYFYGNP